MNAAYAARKATGKCSRCRKAAALGKTLCVAHTSHYAPRRIREPTRKPSPKPTTPRECLRCDHTFASEGPHHRLCGPCREHLHQQPSPETVHRPMGLRSEREG